MHMNIKQQEVELLRDIDQNARMGRYAIKRLPRINDSKLQNHLDIQCEEYNNIHLEASKMLYQRGTMGKTVPVIDKLASRAMIGLKTAVDKSSQNISEMMLQGSMMGIIEATKNENKYKEKNISEEIKSLNKKLLATEESNVEHLKGFL